MSTQVSFLTPPPNQAGWTGVQMRGEPGGWYRSQEVSQGTAVALLQEFGSIEQHLPH